MVSNREIGFWDKCSCVPIIQQGVGLVGGGWSLVSAFLSVGQAAVYAIARVTLNGEILSEKKKMSGLEGVEDVDSIVKEKLEKADSYLEGRIKVILNVEMMNHMRWVGINAIRAMPIVGSIYSLWICNQKADSQSPTAEGCTVDKPLGSAEELLFNKNPESSQQSDREFHRDLYVFDKLACMPVLQQVVGLAGGGWNSFEVMLSAAKIAMYKVAIMAMKLEINGVVTEGKSKTLASFKGAIAHLEDFVNQEWNREMPRHLYWVGVNILRIIPVVATIYSAVVWHQFVSRKDSVPLLPPQQDNEHLVGVLISDRDGPIF